MTAISETKTKPSAIDAQDALNTCKQCVGMLYCIMEAGVVESEDREGALGLATYQLHKHLQIVRDFFEMDKAEERAAA